MRVDHRLLRVDARGQIVEHEVQHIVLDMLGGVAVGDHLIVGDDDVGVHTLVLHGHALADRAEIMAQMQPPRRPVAGEHGEFAGIGFDFGRGGIRTFFRR